MKKKTIISIFLTLLMLVSTFSIVDAENKKIVKTVTPYPPGDIDFTKSVWNETSQEWVDAIFDVEIGTIVRFNITLAYYKDETSPEEWNLSDINITDILPECLNFYDNVVFYNAPDIETVIVDNYLFWDFTDTGHKLEDEETMSIEFDCVVVDSEETDNENIANVSAWEGGMCCNLQAEDYAWVYVYIPPPLEFEKKVFDPVSSEWVDLLEVVKIGDIVKFKLVVIYNGFENVEPMKHMVVDDYLPLCCINYIEGSEVFTYPNEELFEDPVITIDENHIKYDWTTKMFNLFSDQEIIIEFQTEVVEYCYEIVENCAFVDLFNCYECRDGIHLYADDCAKINCTPLPPVFEKKVWDPVEEEWVEEISGFVDDIITFKIELTYYGNYNLTEISIVDYMPCCLQFIVSDPEVTNISEDGKTVWWNFSDPLEDAETITIEFTTKAVGTSSCGCGTNTACVSAIEVETPFEDCDTAEVSIGINNPPCAPDVDGDMYGQPGEELTYKAWSCDPNDDDIEYMFDWGDESTSEWLGPKESCEEIEVTHYWEANGTYEVRAKARDIFGEESQWTYYPLTVIIEEEMIYALNVSINKGLARKISFTIKNTGNVDINQVTWNITVQRKILNQIVVLSGNGGIYKIGEGMSKTITKSPRAFGLITVTVQVNAPGINQIEKTAQGFILGKFVRLK